MNNKRIVLIKFVSAFLAVVAAYFPTFLWMWDRWFASESYYGHGILIPLVSAFIVWQRRSSLKKIKATGDMAGLWVIAAALFVHIICSVLKVAFISGFSLVFVVYGLVLFFFGREMVRNLMFPIFFLLAMIPLPLVLIGNLTVKLKLFAAQIATFILNNIGFPSIRDGSIIRMPNSYVAVEAPCSGLRSLISLLTLGVVFSYAMKASYVKKLVVFISSVPIAIATNVMRIVLLGVVNDLYGQKVAMGFVHDASGFLVFAIAFLALLWVSRSLEDRTGGASYE